MITDTVNAAFLQKFEAVQPFSDREAWVVFRLAAIGEAVGWTLLIAGILTKRYLTPASNTPVIFAGRIHGTIFLCYLLAVGLTYSSLKWSRKRVIVAAAASVPPYGTLIFEQWAAYQRRSQALKTYRAVTVRAIIIKGSDILAIQPKENGYWQLPGGSVGANETAEQALQRLTMGQTGVSPKIGRLVYIRQYRGKTGQQLEMYFSVTNTFAEQRLKPSKLLDGLTYLKPKANPDLEPVFLRSRSIVAEAKRPTAPTIFIEQ